ncbi:glucosylglycerol-phosphate synthase [Sagittula sp. S175]|uniref:glucosylglycerol-phosphate synthase n=1 Tax=Sagittula sp. S175 TaxID=3415129 RepID=UPI003C7C03AE
MPSDVQNRSDLVIVYHRQPYEEVEVNGKIEYRENKSPNGIVPTLKSFFGRVDKGAWIAWKHAEDPSNPGFERVVEIDDPHGKYTVSRLPLTPEQVTSFYHVSSKEAFWPILHGFKERYNYDPVDWSTFREVNWAFAEAAAAEAADGATVWVHDYNLWLVPGYLRTLRPDVKISFFHHTPFPGADIFNVLPWRREILESLMACDVVGFHIPRYVNNFVSAARSLLEVDTQKREKVSPELNAQTSALSEQSVVTELAYEGRTVRLQASPVGVDVDYIETLATSDRTLQRFEQIMSDLGDRRLILSVGRTDYTKGGIEQLESYERLLESRPDLRGRIQLMHVSVMANENMTAYRQIQEDLEHMAGRINGRYGSFDWQPLVLISRPVPFADLVAYYRAADIAWITPLADGMNLVCKEYAAARTDGDGVLVLSEFAGAAVELATAVPTNPFSHKSMDSALQFALDMPEDERRGRMKLLRHLVRLHDVRFWAEDQMQAFGKGTPQALTTAA